MRLCDSIEVSSISAPCCLKIESLCDNINYLHVYLFFEKKLGIQLPLGEVNFGSRRYLKSIIDEFESKLKDEPNMEFKFKFEFDSIDSDLEFKPKYITVNFDNSYIRLLLDYFKYVYFNGGVVVCETSLGSMHESDLEVGCRYKIETYNMLGHRISLSALLEKKSCGELFFHSYCPEKYGGSKDFTVNPEFHYNKISPSVREIKRDLSCIDFQKANIINDLSVGKCYRVVSDSDDLKGKFFPCTLTSVSDKLIELRYSSSYDDKVFIVKIPMKDFESGATILEKVVKSVGSELKDLSVF